MTMVSTASWLQLLLFAPTKRAGQFCRGETKLSHFFLEPNVQIALLAHLTVRNEL